MSWKGKRQRRISGVYKLYFPDLRFYSVLMKTTLSINFIISSELFPRRRVLWKRLAKLLHWLESKMRTVRHWTIWFQLQQILSCNSYPLHHFTALSLLIASSRQLQVSMWFLGSERRVQKEIGEWWINENRRSHIW